MDATCTTMKSPISNARTLSRCLCKRVRQCKMPKALQACVKVKIQEFTHARSVAVLLCHGLIHNQNLELFRRVVRLHVQVSLG